MWGGLNMGGGKVRGVDVYGGEGGGVMVSTH